MTAGSGGLSNSFPLGLSPAPIDTTIPQAPYDPGRWDFPSPVLTLAFPSPPAHEVRNAPADTEHAPNSRGLPAKLVPTGRTTVILAQGPGPVRNRQVPRVPSPASGVTVSGGMSHIPWTGITRPSSLLRTHAPVLIPRDGLGW